GGASERPGRRSRWEWSCPYCWSTTGRSWPRRPRRATAASAVNGTWDPPATGVFLTETGPGPSLLPVGVYGLSLRRTRLGLGKITVAGDAPLASPRETGQFVCRPFGHRVKCNLMPPQMGRLTPGGPIMTTANQPPASPDPTASLFLEEAVARFENAWQRGERPAIDDHVPDGNVAILVEIVHADLEFRLEAAEPQRVETYLARYPALAADPALAVELIRAEYRL